MGPGYYRPMLSLPVTIGAAIKFERPDPDDARFDRMISELRREYTWENPAPSRGGDPQWTSPDWCALRENRDAGTFTLPRGLVGGLQRIAGESGVRIDVESRVTWREDRPLVDLGEFTIVPREEYQTELIDLLIEKVQGYIVSGCGSGKTCTGVLALLRLNQSSLVLVPTRDLLDQWAGTIRRALGGDLARRVRIIGGDHGVDLSPLRPGEIAIAIPGGLYQNPDAPRFLRSVAVLVNDEAHRLGSDSWSWVTERCAARWRWGLTATPDRADGFGFILGCLLGRKLKEVPTRMLLDLGYLNRPTIVPVRSRWKPTPACYWWNVTCPRCAGVTRTTWGPWQEGLTCALKVISTGPKGGKVRTTCGAELGVKAKARRDTLHWSVAVNVLSDDEDRQELLIELSRRAIEADRRVLVLVGRKSCLPGLVQGIRGHGARAESVASGAAGRDERIAALRRGHIDALVATQLADEGLDVPALDCVVLGQPGKDKGRATQRAGRACRPEGLPPVIFDVVDDSPEFENQWRSRRAAYEEAYGRECLAARDALPVAEAVKHLARLAGA